LIRKFNKQWGIEMIGRLDGKVALVTGSGRGIGREIALKLAADGASVVVNDVDEEPAQEVAEQIRAAGGRAVACIGSVTSDEFAGRFVGTAVREFSGLDIVVNNAGYAWDNVIQKVSDEQWATMLDVHLTAPFRILRAAQPVIRDFVKQESVAGQRKVRKVVNISSAAGMSGNAGQSAYSAAKAGIHGMTRTLAKEWGRMNVTVNCVAFGLIKTRLLVSTAEHVVQSIDGHDLRIGVNADLFERLQQQIPLGRAGTPEEGAGAVYLFCIPESDYVSGQVVLCGGGLAGI
jgi:3-oxoacyl-[acyl-carrier protein] reductase